MPGFSKTDCPVSRRDFRADATPLPVVINGKEFIAEAKQFSTGSLGWHYSGKVTALVGGVPVTCQANVLITAVGSKELPHEAETPSANVA